MCKYVRSSSKSCYDCHKENKENGCSGKYMQCVFITRTKHEFKIITTLMIPLIVMMIIIIDIHEDETSDDIEIGNNKLDTIYSSIIELIIISITTIIR